MTLKKFAFSFISYIVCCLFVTTPLPSLAVETILVNRPLSEKDTRYEYPNLLLKKVLEVTQSQYGKARIQYSKLKMPRDRTLIELEKGTHIHVMAEAQKPGWEERLIPIRIPIRKGIQGYRTFLILKKNQSALSKINTLEQLRAIPTGSGQQWSTTSVLIENGFNVKEGRDYEGLFNMLVQGRFTTFGRGINETQTEYLSHKKLYPNLAIEKDLLLYIPLTTYFFVTPRLPSLAKRIEKGLLNLIESGVFDNIFNDEFGDIIENSQLKKRKVFKIENSNLSSKTPFDIKEYWYTP